MDPAKESESPTQSTLENDNEITPVVVRREAETDLFTWRAPSRPFRRRSKEFYVTLFAIVGIIGLILFIAEGAMPVVLLIAIVFLFYVLSTVPPEEIEYKITSKGIRVGGTRTDWKLTERFWFTTKSGIDVLLIDTFVGTGRLEMVIKPEDREAIRKQLSLYVDEEEIKPTNFERAVNWFSSRLPDNK